LISAAKKHGFQVLSVIIKIYCRNLDKFLNFWIKFYKTWQMSTKKVQSSVFHRNTDEKIEKFK
jgi:hypothetical protein